MEPKELVIRDARIIFRNFAGAASMYNAAGERNFAVVLDEATAADLDRDGWNVKYLKPRDEGDIPTPYLSVKVNYSGNRPPRITMITSNARTNLDEGGVSVLDYADFEKVDLVIRGFDWVVGDKSGTKGYLKSMFVTLAEDVLEREYAINSIEEGG